VLSVIIQHGACFLFGEAKTTITTVAIAQKLKKIRSYLIALIKQQKKASHKSRVAFFRIFRSSLEKKNAKKQKKN